MSTAPTKTYTFWLQARASDEGEKTHSEWRGLTRTMAKAMYKATEERYHHSNSAKIVAYGWSEAS
jgi:hypothetical protein